MIIVCKDIQICQYNKKTGATKSVAPVLLFTMSDGSDRKKTSITSFNWLISSKIYRKVIHDGKFIQKKMKDSKKNPSSLKISCLFGVLNLLKLDIPSQTEIRKLIKMIEQAIFYKFAFFTSFFVFH